VPAVPGFDAVILAGGGGRRLGGVDKAGLLVAGLPLLDRVLLASAAARRTVVVGESRPTVRPVRWAQEDPPGGGPLAGLAAGLAELLESVESSEPARPGEPVNSAESAEKPEPDSAQNDVVVVLATDLPRLTSADVERLCAALAAEPAAEVAAFVDAEGREQPLSAAYRIGPIRAALAGVGPLPGKAVKLVFHQLVVVTVPDLGAAGDCDTPDQLAAARAHFDRQG
jgi:molybdopterin-guanine dinucleotide biosynthesis protein A